LHNSGANQSDASFGLTAGLAEALLQSHADEISLLPALPPGWKNGSVSGLRARGGFEVSIRWENGRLLSAELRNQEKTECKVRYGEKTASLNFDPGVPVLLTPELTAFNLSPR
jgi:alpha-L-fucosidase 2